MSAPTAADMRADLADLDRAWDAVTLAMALTTDAYAGAVAEWRALYREFRQRYPRLPWEATDGH